MPSRLQEGNKRFASGLRRVATIVKQIQRAELVEKQGPFAIILGGSDSRVPAGMIFDQGLGDLFVNKSGGQYCCTIPDREC